MTEEIKNTRKWIAENLTSLTDNDWSDPVAFVEKIQPRLPSILKLVSLPPTYEEGKYNCFVYALGLQDDSVFLRKEKRPDMSTFVMINSPQMIRLQSSFEKTDEPIDGDYIFYKNGRIVTHGGIYRGGDMVESKWSDGPIFKHPIFAVNPTYGEEISFYRKANPESIKNALVAMDVEFKSRSSLRVMSV